MLKNDDCYYFLQALKEANKAFKTDNVPVGCVIIYKNKIIAKSYNKKNCKKISIYHAEMLAIIKACKYLNTFILDECIMYVTLKPCEMCMNAIAESRIKNVKYLIPSHYDNNLKKNYSYIKCRTYNNNKYIQIYKNMLSSFFKNIRNK